MLDKIELVHIVACDLNGCIGNNGEIPWHLPADLKRFKELTSGGVVVMGRKTFESLNCKPLPNRVNMVITNNMPFMAKHSRSNVIFYSSISTAIEEAKYEASVLGLKEVWIIGGQSIYEQTMPYVDRIEKTLVYGRFNGDTHYKLPLNIEGISSTIVYTDAKSSLDYQFLTCKVNREMEKNSYVNDLTPLEESIDTFMKIPILTGRISLDGINTSLGLKYDSNKPRYSLLPPNTLLNVVQVLEYGAIKYEPNNWRHVADARTRYYDAAMRHIDDWWNGSEIDEESSLPHLAHAICCLLFLLWFDDQE